MSRGDKLSRTTGGFCAIDLAAPAAQEISSWHRADVAVSSLIGVAIIGRPMRLTPLARRLFRPA
jgi:hypothetical protein